MPSTEMSLVKTRCYTAGTYAKVTGAMHPSQPDLKPRYNISFCSWKGVAGPN